MKFSRSKKTIFSLTWLLSAVFLLHQLPGLAIDTPPNIVKPIQTIPAVVKTSKIKSVQELSETALKQQLQLNENVDDKIFSLQSEFKAFPANSTIDLTLREIDVASVLRVIAKEGGKNIVLDQSVQGTISAELKNISLNQAMQTVLTSQELEARVEGNTILVGSRPAMAKKGLNRKFIKAFKLNNANAIDISKLLEASIFNKGYSVKEDSSSAGVAMQAVANPTPNTAQAEPAKPAGTSTGQSSLTSAKVIRGKIEKLNPGDSFHDASKLASAIKVQNVTSTIENVDVSNNDGGAIVIPDTRTNSVLVAGLQEDILLAQEAIKYLDKALPQVSIEVSLVELKKDDVKNLGLSALGYSRNNVSTGFNIPLSDPINYANSAEFGIETVKNLSDNITFRVKSLITNGKAKLLANPTIIALDGSESLIKITDRIISKMDITVTQTSVSYNPELQDIGIVLNILPKIADDGYVTMRVRPSITTSLGRENIGNFGAFATLISTREVLLQDARVRAGESLAIAGLLKESDVTNIGKIPLVSNLPIFGKLFQNKETTHSKTELVILITPKIINDVASNKI